MARRRTPYRPCHTYWGSHGCKKNAGHAGPHLCTCDFDYNQWLEWQVKHDTGLVGEVHGR